MDTGTTHQHALSGPQRPSHRTPTSPLGVGLRYTVMWLSVALVVVLLVANALR